MGPNPPPAFSGDDTGDIVTIDRDLQTSPFGAPPPGYQPPTGIHGPDPHRTEAVVRPSTLRRAAPIAIIAVAALGGAVFAVLSVKKAHDDLAAAQATLAETEAERDTAVATAGDEQKKAEALENKLAVVTKVATRAQQKIKKTNQKADDLEKKLRSLASETASEVERDGDRLTLKLVDKVLFRSGESDLTDRGKTYLRKVGDTLKKADDKQIWVQGHTDNVPVAPSNSRFASNWELSSARALTVVHFLENEVGIKGRRLAAVAFSKYRPVSRRRKARNRRIEIVLAPQRVRLVD